MREGIVICALAVTACSAAHAERAAVTAATLPAGCVFATGVYTCGTIRYRPYYDGPTVV